MKEFAEEVKNELAGHPSFRVYAVSNSSKEEPPALTGLMVSHL